MMKYNFISVDTSTFIIDKDSVSFNDVLSMLHLPSAQFDSSLLSAYMNALDVQFFQYHGIQFGVKSRDLKQNLIEAYQDYGDIERPYFPELFNVKFGFLRVNITGKGMKWCRSNFLDRDKECFDQFLLDCQDYYQQDYGWHFSRNDIALDFVNYFESPNHDIISDIYYTYSDKCREKLDNDLRRIDFVFCNRSNVGSPGKGLAFNSKVGDSERTLYIGSPSSDVIMRIYDKFLEQTDYLGHFQPAYNPDSDQLFLGLENSDIKSWIRFEVQLRNKSSQLLLFTKSLSDPLSFANWVWSRFSPGPRAFDDNNNYKNLDLKEFPFWTNFFREALSHPIKVNNHFVQSDISSYDKACRYIDNTAITNLFMTSLPCKNMGEFYKLYNDKFLDILNSFKDPNKVKGQKQLFSLYKMLANMDLDISFMPSVYYNSLYDVYGLKLDDNNIYYGKYLQLDKIEILDNLGELK